MAGEIQKIEPLNLPELHNAQLSGEQRTGQAAVLHRKTLYLTHSKTATRWESTWIACYVNFTVNSK